MEKEQSLLQLENSKMKKDIKQTSEKLRDESEARSLLEQKSIELEEQLKITKQNFKDLQKSNIESESKLERITALNDEMRELIGQERQYNEEEL